MAEQTLDEGITFSGNLHQGRINGDTALRTPDYTFEGQYAYGKPIKGTFRFPDSGTLIAEQITTRPRELLVKGQFKPRDRELIIIAEFTLELRSFAQGVIATNQPVPSRSQKRVFASGLTHEGTFNGNTPTGTLLVIDENGLDQLEIWKDGKQIAQSPGPLSIKARVSEQPCRLSAPYGNWAWYGLQCQNGQPAGEGIAYSPDGKSFFSGTFNNGQWLEGELEDESGHLLTGNWKNFKLHGLGSEISNGELSYRGSYQAGKRHGDGICKQGASWVPCKHFKGKELTNQSALVRNATEKTRQLIASADRYQADQIARFNRDRNNSASLWRDRQNEIRQKEGRRKSEVAQNMALYNYAVQHAEQTANELAAISQQTSQVIQQAYAEQDAKNEKAMQKYLADKAAYEAEIKRQEEAQAAYIAQLEENYQAKVDEANAQLLAKREQEKADCIAAGFTWNEKGNNCRSVNQIIIGETCFDENQKPRGCTLEEFEAKQAKRKAEGTFANSPPDDWPSDWSRPAVMNPLAQVDSKQNPGKSVQETGALNAPGQGVSPGGSNPLSNKRMGDASASGPSLSKENQGKTTSAKRSKNDIVRVEALAYCDTNDKGLHWCHGPVQNLLLRYDEPIEDVLESVGCENAKESRRAPFHSSKRKHPGWIYYCEYGRNSYDIDISKHYEVPATYLQNRNSYRCPEFTVSTCDRFYRAQDGNRENGELIPADAP